MIAHIFKDKHKVAEDINSLTLLVRTFTVFMNDKGAVHMFKIDNGMDTR